MLDVTVRFFAGAADVAGVAERRLSVPADSTLATTLARVAEGNEPLSRVLQRSSLLVNERATTDRETRVTSGSIIDVLPPFAGG